MNVTKTYIMMPVEDMTRATAFYSEVFGLEVVMPAPDWTELTLGPTVTLALRTAPVDGVETGLGFEVDDIEAACAVVREAGGRVVSEPQDRPGEPIRLAQVTDCEGNRLSLAEPLG